MRILRMILGVIVGVVLGGIVNMALVTLGPSVFPSPEGVDMTSAESLAATIHLLEPRHFVFPFLAHAMGTLTGSIVAFLVAGHRGTIYLIVVGVVFLAGGIAASMMIPAPAWFIALDLIVAYLPMAWLGARIAARVAPAARTEAPGA